MELEVLVILLVVRVLLLVTLVTRVVVDLVVDTAALDELVGPDEVTGFVVVPPAVPSVPVSLMSRELAPTDTTKLPVGVIHALVVTSQ